MLSDVCNMRTCNRIDVHLRVHILNKMRTQCKYCRRLNELFQTYQIYFMNFWYIEHYAASFGDDFDAK